MNNFKFAPLHWGHAAEDVKLTGNGNYPRPNSPNDEWIAKAVVARPGAGSKTVESPVNFEVTKPTGLPLTNAR